MKVQPCHLSKEDWNTFVVENYPEIGGFMASYEWGEFQEKLGRKYERLIVSEKKKVVALVTIVFYKLPLGFWYAYCPRTPIFRKDTLQSQGVVHQIFHLLKIWIKKNNTKVIFLRTEPPVPPEIQIDSQFKILKRYVQPKKNLYLNLDKELSDICAEFHPTTRANIKKAEKLGVKTEYRENITEAEMEQFYFMTEDTMNRNGGKNAYPPREYFEAMLKTLEAFKNKEELSVGYFFAYIDGVLASIIMVLFFGDTATYIYGASDSKYLKYKTSAYIHYSAIKKAKEMGFLYYDLGGIDEERWESLTYFKRQFRGIEKEYIGNVDIVLKDFHYLLYRFLRSIYHKK